ncbi:uncharacterized protein MKK02DRAFT_26856 [Dioszegia hungarica]|uniref:Family A G protein-coupled receptor-like protein n=1 Tax=Dioszegia hungarica TaxID=4972 RepID=A0AA38H7H9_9TREE|nr:uncharacterized protein MKK02DRAFT_26856 [Dioszegia hungarica]KAI9635180.1 hypothetical protein MKK02DRAFT_26856 [Dioszegia hungarica]
MANDALLVNPDNQSQLGITTHGSDWLWAVFAVMLLTDLVVIGWHFTIPRGQRLFHQLGAIILTTATIAYFSMASNLGSTPIATEFAYLGYPIGTLRQIWYVRYIDWVITTPALLLELTLASGLPLSDIITLVFFDLVMIITGLVGALVASSYKWGYYVFGNLALFYILWVLFGPARTSAGAIGPAYKRSFTSSAAVLSFLWFLYPIAWGIADGASVIHPDSEMIFYGVLDVLAKPVFIIYHLFSLSKLDLTALRLQSGKFTDSADVTHHDREKHARANDMATAGTAAPAKKGMFSRKGARDATPAVVTTYDNEPRTSQATYTAA